MKITDYKIKTDLDLRKSGEGTAGTKSPLGNDVNYINIQGQCQYVNTRPQNPTRIDVRGAYMFSVKVFSQQKVGAVTAISGSDICCDSRG